MNIKTSQATKSNRRDAGKYKNYSLALQNTITVESDYFVRSIWMSHFLVRFFFVRFFAPTFLSNLFECRFFSPIFLSDLFIRFFCPFFFCSLFRPTFCPLNVRFFVRSICLTFYPIYVNVRFLVRIFCPIFCLNNLNVRFFRPIFFVRVLSDSMVRITQLQCPASLSLKSMAKLNWLNRNFLFHV